MSAPTSSQAPPPPAQTPSGGGGGGGNSGPTSSPLLFFVALGFGVVFTNLWIIVGVKYCFRYNQRNRRHHQDENGEPIDMANMPRTHRRRREKKLMTMDEVNDRFPLTKYKAWMAFRAEEGLPTAGGIAAPQTPAASVRNLEGAASTEMHHRSSQDSGKLAAASSSVPHEKEKTEKEAIDSPKHSMKSPLPRDNASPSMEAPTTQQPESTASQSTAPQTIGPRQSPTAETAPQPSTAPPTRQEVQDDNDMDDDDQIQIAVPTEMLANPGDTCAICIDTLEDDDDVRGLTCGHAFHASCLDPWLTSRRACCPLCKADYYVPKPRTEGDAAAESDRHAGRRNPNISRGPVNRMNQPQYTFMGRRDGRPRMILPGRFMTIGHFDDNQAQRYGFPTVQRQPRPSEPNQEAGGDQAGEQGQQPNTWRSRLPNLTVPRPVLFARFRQRNATSDQQPSEDTRPDAATVSPDPTPAQLEAGHRSQTAAA
ncbi:MAG: hypothetical protein LQ345_004261 [Seirophora villosa]|nr:MAG: hypothetical protein LQ345_004261 [Seirophora villosa]